jgi:hypothetical protein
MTKPLRDQEFRAVMALPGQKQYIHSIKQMAD